MKKCPFCKNEIKIDATQCPICKMTLAEKVSSIQSTQKQSSTPPPKEATEKSYTYYTPPRESTTSKSRFQMPKGGGWVISFLVSVLLSVILSNVHSSSNPLPPPASEPVVDNKAIDSAPVPHAPYNSLKNGAILFSSPSSFNGPGILSISNGSGSDAVVKLITSSGRKVYSVYIKANNTYSIENISDGVYRLLFAFGSDWDPDQKKFLVNPSAESFDDSFDFETSDTHYKEYDITLNPVVNGKATASSLDPSAFDKY